MNETLQHINELVASNRIDEAIEMCNRVLDAPGAVDNPAMHDWLVERGKLLWRTGNRGGAVTDYNRAARMRPDGPAAALLAMSNDILDFYNPDQFNP